MGHRLVRANLTPNRDRACHGAPRVRVRGLRCARFLRGRRAARALPQTAKARVAARRPYRFTTADKPRA